MNKEGRNNAGSESEIESKVVTVGSNRGHRALIVIVLGFLISGIYYLYSNPSFDEENVEVIKEKAKQNVHELKEKLEQVPDNTMISERIIMSPLPPLPSLPTPQVIPEVKQRKKEEVVKKEKPKETPVSNMPTLPKQNLPYGKIISNVPNPFPIIGGGGYPKDRRSAQMLAIYTERTRLPMPFYLILQHSQVKLPE